MDVEKNLPEQAALSSDESDDVQNESSVEDDSVQSDSESNTENCEPNNDQQSDTENSSEISEEPNSNEKNLQEIDNDGQINFAELKDTMIETLSLVFAKGEDANERTKPRSVYIQEFVKYVTQYYDYNEFLADKFFQLFGRSVMDAFDANEDERPLSIRPNLLKTTKSDLVTKLIKKNAKIARQSDLTASAVIVKDSAVPIGATTEYLCGLYAIQGIASLMPVIALDPKPKTKALDLCAAPGGKTCFMSSLMKNSGILFANDNNKDRLKSIFSNVHRMGCENVIISNEDARNFSNYATNFDSVLVDAPCSGTGVISKDKRAKKSKNSNVIAKCAALQKEILLSGIKCCKNGGHVVYSTCSVMPEENEQVIEYIIQKCHVKIVDTGIKVGENGMLSFKSRKFNKSMELCRRFYPHLHDTDGFFVCKLLKISDEKPSVLEKNIDKRANDDESVKESPSVEETSAKEAPKPKKVKFDVDLTSEDQTNDTEPSITSMNFKKGENVMKAKKKKARRPFWKRKQIQNMRKKDYQRAIEKNKKSKN